MSAEPAPRRAADGGSQTPAPGAGTGSAAGAGAGSGAGHSESGLHRLPRALPAAERDATQPGAGIGLPNVPGYRIEETLGKGSTGVVFRATQVAVDRPVALKILHPDLAGRPRAVRRLQREARTAARLAHPNIVGAIDMGEADGLWWYAMELVEGEPLSERLKRVGRLTEREALRLFTPLVDALDHAFKESVVHRDIKPANILIDKAGRPRLVDLGLAFREDDPKVTSPGGTLGTPQYVSPEQARNPTEADTRSDIWSLGATMYHGVCGRPPFSGESVAEILSRVLYGRITDPQELEPTLSRGFALMLRKCLARDPVQRYQTPHELLDDLERLREKRPVGVRTQALDPVERRRDPRAVWAWSGVAAVVLAVLGLLAWSRGWPPFSPRAGGAGSPDLVPASARWSELEAVAAKVHGPDRDLAPTLIDLAELKPAPTRYRARYAEVEEQLLERYREARANFATRIKTELERLLNARDFVGASELIGDGLQTRIRAELAVRPSQMDEVLTHVRQGDLAVRVSRELDQYMDSLSRRVEDYFRDAIFAKVANDRNEGAWRTALAELARPPLDRLAEANIATAGLPPERVAILEQALLDELRHRREELESEWRTQDFQLAQELDQRYLTMVDMLRQRAPLAHTAAIELEQWFERRCVELHVRSDQGLFEVSREAPAKLARLKGELDQLERNLVEEDARAWLVQERQNAEEFLRERRFSELADVWTRARASEWLAPVRREIDVELHAAQLLAGLLSRAREGVLALDGKRTSILIGTIEVSGRLVSGSDPLQFGFRLEPDQGPTCQLALRPLLGPRQRATVLGPEAIERLAGLPADVALTTDPADRVARALLRHSEGDVAGAQRALVADDGQWGGDASLAILARRLSSDVGRAVEERAAQREQLEAQARTQLNVLLRAIEEVPNTGDADGVARQIEEFLNKFGGLELVRAQQPRLRSARERLQGRPSTVSATELARRLGAVDGEQSASGRATLRFAFAGPIEPKWQRGNWRPDGKGWMATGGRSVDQLADDLGIWPRLALDGDFDLDSPMQVRVAFEQAAESGEPQLFALSVAGVHVLLRGARGAQKARWLAGSGGDDEFRRLVDDIERNGKGQEFAGLVRGETYELGLELSKHRGKWTLTLSGPSGAGSGADFGGAVLGSQDCLPPDGKPGSGLWVVRSLEPVRLLSASLAARQR